jgi:glycosyltransferase involved in cell wall biosynthesis
MKIAVINNYDMRGIKAAREKEQNNAPAQHLWGIVGLPEVGIQTEIVDFKSSGWLKKFSDKVKILGDLHQQFQVLKKQNQYDAIYSAHHLSTLLLSALRHIGVLRIPLIAIAYQAPRSRSLFWTLFVRLTMGGNDKLLCLSQALVEDLANFGIPRSKLQVIHWGVDLPFYGEGKSDQPAENRFIFSSGKSYRDYPTLLGAIGNHELVICGAGKTVSNDPNIGERKNIKIIQEMIGWQEFIRTYQDAFIVVIVLEANQDRFKNALGLTVLSEALAVGKAIVMTRNDYVGIDLEAEGIGLWVDPGDVAGLQEKLTYLMNNPEVAKAMGRKARILAERKYNLNVFTLQLAHAIKSQI